MSESTPTLAQVLKRVIATRLADVHTAMPARVESFDAGKQMVNVKPLVKRNLLGDDNTLITDDLPVINNVPVAFPSGGGFVLAFPLAQGDTVLLVFSERSIDQWKTKGGEVDDKNTRNHDLSDAFAVPCVRALPQKLQGVSASKLVLGKDSTPALQIHIDGTDIKIGSTATNYVAMANLVQGRLDALATALNGWTPVSQDGGAALKTALAGWVAGSNNVAATKVKAV
jgi:hypothetical protein